MVLLALGSGGFPGQSESRQKGIKGDSSMKRRSLRTNVVAAAVAVSLSLVLGCASMAPDERPEITLSNLELTEATLFETTMVASVRIANPSLEPIVIEGATFKLVLNGKKVGRGMMKDSVAVDALDSHIGIVTFHVNNASALLRLRGVMDRGAVEYGIVGNLYLKRGSGTQKVKVEQGGRLDLDEVTPVNEAEVER